MNVFKRLVSAALSIILLLSLCFAASADEAWPDITGHKYENYILKALEKGYISGYGDGTVRPDREITKKEAVSIIVKNLVEKPAALSEGSRTQNIVKKAMNWGLINSGNNMSSSIDRLKAYTMLAAAAGIGEGEDDSVIGSLADSKYIEGEARGMIAGLISRGIITPVDGRLGVFKTVTRAEFIMLFMKLDEAGLWTAAKKELNNTSISKVKLSFEHSERLKEGEPMRVTVNITGGKRGTECSAVWYKNGIEEGREDIVLSGKEHQYTFEIDYIMSDYTPDSAVVGFELYHMEKG
ncbi:MAG: S-layer homology domain-containing protein, partial [Oscillospiraceae bacterium]|nr:S-layer homology domain-containing protein [Oscillospiraceae bacterium]